MDSISGATIRLSCVTSVPPATAGATKVAGARSCIGLEGILDGTANTILYGEKRLHVRLLGTSRDDNDGGYTRAFDHETMRYSDLKPRPDRLDAVAGNTAADNGDRRFGSSHPSGFNVVMCDGAVKSISYSIESQDNNLYPNVTNLASNMTLFNKLGIRNDGMPAALPE